MIKNKLKVLPKRDSPILSPQQPRPNQHLDIEKDMKDEADQDAERRQVNAIRLTYHGSYR